VLTEQRACGRGDEQRLHGGHQRRGAGRHAERDARDDPAQVQALAQQPEHALAQQRARAEPGAQHAREHRQCRARHEIAPGEEGVGGREPRAQLGPDEPGAPQHHQRRACRGIRPSLIHGGR
jgi:hypothetical protein